MYHLKKMAILLSLCLAGISQINLANATGMASYKNDSTIIGSAAQTRTGWSMANVGHFSSLDRDDLAITVPYKSGAYATYVIFGTQADELPQVENIDKYNQGDALKIIIPDSIVNGNNKFALTVQKVGDLNGDGYDELVLTFPYYSKKSESTVYVIWGGPHNKIGNRAANQINLADIDNGDNRRGFKVSGPGWFGSSASGIRYSAATKNDANKNLVDLAIGDISSINNRGGVTVIYGRKGSAVGSWKNIAMQWEGSKSNDTFKLVPKDKTTATAFISSSYGSYAYDSAYVTDPLKPANVNLGAQVIRVGDINGNGQDDYVIVDPYAYNSAAKGYIGGTAYLVFGNNNFTTDHLKLNALSKTEAIRLHGMQNSYLGQASTGEGYMTNQTVTGLGNCFASTTPDATAPDSFAISAPYYKGSNSKRSGIVWVIKGKKAGTDTVGKNGTLALDAYHEVSNYTKQFSKKDGYAIRSSRDAADGMGFGTAVTTQDMQVGDVTCKALVISDPNAKRNGSKVGAVYIIHPAVPMDKYADDDGMVAIEDLITASEDVNVIWGDGANNMFGQSVVSGTFFGADFGNDKPNSLAISSPDYANSTGKVDLANTQNVN